MKNTENTTKFDLYSHVVCSLSIFSIEYQSLLHCDLYIRFTYSPKRRSHLDSNPHFRPPLHSITQLTPPQLYNTVPTDSRGYLTLQGYLSQWTLWTLLGAGRTLEYLGHLGYSYVMEEQQSAAIHGENWERMGSMGSVLTQVNVFVLVRSRSASIDWGYLLFHGL